MKINKYKTFESFLKEIKKPRREYEKQYIIGKSGGFIINNKGKRREKYHDILLGIYVSEKKKEIILSYLRIIYDNYSKIGKITKNTSYECENS